MFEPDRTEWNAIKAVFDAVENRFERQGLFYSDIILNYFVSNSLALRIDTLLN